MNTLHHTLPLTLLAALCVVGSSACIEPSRESQRDTAADTYCARLDECGDIGSGQRYSSFDDCLIAQRDAFNNLWPADECSDGRINEERYESCLSKLRTGDCNANLFDAFSFTLECNSGEVCTDPIN